MVDSVKQYNLAGVAANVELGKQGPVIDASNASVISFKDKNGNLEVIAVAEGTDPTHAVSLSQLGSTTLTKLNYQKFEVAYNSGTVALANAAANAYIHSVVVEKTAGNWTGANSNTTITVGDSSNNSRLFAGFDPASQCSDESDHKYATETTINAYVTAGGANAGNAYITIWYSGTLNEAPAGGGGGGGGGSAGVDNVVGYSQMPGPVTAGGTLEDPTATINGSTGFTINDDTKTGIAITGLTASNNAWFAANYPTVPGTYTCTWGPGSTVASSSIFVVQLTSPGLVFYVQGQSGPATYNYPFTFGT